MKDFLDKIEWSSLKKGFGRFGMSPWRLAEYDLAHVLVQGSKRDEDYVIKEDIFADPQFEETIFKIHLKDLAFRIKRLGFMEGSYHGKKIDLSGALGACCLLHLSPLDFWYMAAIDKNDPGEEFWEAVQYMASLEVYFE